MSSVPAISESEKKPDVAPEDYPKKLSKGHKLFNWLTYGGIAGVITFLLSIPVGCWARYNPKGQASIKWVAKHLKKVGMSDHVAEDVVMTTALMQGGNAMILPVKIMEDHKPKLVKKFNHTLGEKDDENAVNHEPKQTWMSLINARIFLAWTPVFLSLRSAAMLFGKESFHKFEEKFSEYIICKPLDRPTHVGARIVENETKTFRYGKIAAVDVFATTAAAVLLFIGSRFFARKSKGQESASPAEKTDTKAPAAAADCLPCRIKSFAGSMAPSSGYAETAAAEKGKSSEAYLT